MGTNQDLLQLYENHTTMLTLKYYNRGILKKEIRSYEVSLWTLLDEFITVLKWSDVEQKGRIEEPQMTLDVDGTLNFTFKIPMYIGRQEFVDRLDTNEKDYVYTYKENPIWYNTLNGNLIEGMRKIKVIFNKDTAEKEIFEFVIIKVTEEHEGGIASCQVECEGLAFHELGKIGYKLSLSLDNFALDYKEWSENANGLWTKYDGTIVNYQPILSLQYWCEEGAHLIPLPPASERNAQTWYYYVEMDWSSFAFSANNIERDTHKVYEEPFTNAWSTDLEPIQIQQYEEKARPVEISQSNLYNITLTIAELFGIHCRYEYTHDDNLQITSKVIVFYNNYNRENEGAICFTYPYASKKVSRNTDVSDLTTKLFISSVDGNNPLENVITIMNSPANKTKEDYILNFDYIHKIGGITDEQYESIHTYEKNIRAKNDLIIPLQLELEAFNSKKIEVEAKLTTYTNSVDLDQELIDYNSGLAETLSVLAGDGDGYISITGASPDSAIIISPENGVPYINLERTNKGIDLNTLHIYHKWIPGEKRCTLEITNFTPIRDQDYGNLIKIEGVYPDENNVRTVYLTYKYKPRLYYDNIVKVWQTKIAHDILNKNDLTNELARINSHIDEDTNTLDTLIILKNNLITEFERMMGPALREGYWNPDNYKDYGEVKNTVLSLPKTYTGNIFVDDTITDDIVVGWDNLLFDDESEIYYKVGVDALTLTYYPCINLKSIFESNPNNIRENINDYSFIFNTNYHDDTVDLTNMLYTRAFAVGSEALLKYVKDPNGVIYPILVLVGAKTMSDGTNSSINEIAFMKAENHGHPRIGILTNDVVGTTITTTISNVTPVHSSSYWTFGNYTIDECELVVPRFKFTSPSVKADVTNLLIAYNNLLLTAYENYLILTRVTHCGTDEHPVDHPQYYITIKPDVLWRCIKPVDDTDSDFGKLKINYIIANLATSIYIDALEVAKNNSEPKVEYNLEANLINEDFLHTLYNELARIIMITDNDLKIEDAFGYISHIELNLDKPQEDSILIKNYKNKFEDLFSSIVASTEAVKLNSTGIDSALNGNIGLSPTGFSATLLNNSGPLTSFLDEYFSSSTTVEEKLINLFTEAGEILGNSNKVLSTAGSLTQENASILGQFANKVTNELSPKVFRQVDRPTDFKVGDIWIELKAVPNTNPVEYLEAARYVATSDSLHSVTPYGWTRTYDGSLSLITGAGINVDAAAGKVEIKAANLIDILSGNDIDIRANANVNIHGNESVNIGGTQINIGSTMIENEPKYGGINLVATSYETDGFTNAYESKVLINPHRIEMAGAKITMMTGSTLAASAINAIELDGSKGVWIGSDKKISLFASNNNSNNANVEIDPTHIFFGMNNTTNGNTTAVELNENYIIMAAGVENSSNAVDNIASIVSNGITMDGSLAGIEIKNNKIGLAVGSGNGRTAIIMGSDGLVIGTRGNNKDPVSNGSIVTISGNGIEIGSSGHLKVNTTNFKVNPSATGTTALFYVGTGNETEYIKYSITNGLEISGKLTAGAGSTIGGWTIGADYLGNGSNKYCSVGLLAATGSSQVFWAGYKHNNGNNPENTFYVTASGYVYAKSGSIGGWNMSPGENNSTLNRLFSGSGSGYVALDSNNELTNPNAAWNASTNDWKQPYAIWCGSDTAASAPFRVRRDGKLYCTKLIYLDENNKEQELNFYRDFYNATSVTMDAGWSGNTFTAYAYRGTKLLTSKHTTVTSIDVVANSGTVRNTYYIDAKATAGFTGDGGEWSSNQHDITVNAKAVYDQGKIDGGGDKLGFNISSTNALVSIVLVTSGTPIKSAYVTIAPDGGQTKTVTIDPGGSQTVTAKFNDIAMTSVTVKANSYKHYGRADLYTINPATGGYSGPINHDWYYTT